MLAALGTIRSSLPVSAKRQAWLLLALLLLTTLLESASVGMVVPVLGMSTQPSWLSEHPSIQRIADRVGISQSDHLATWALAALVALFALKTSFGVALAHVESRFAYTVQAQVSERLYAGYLRQPWTFHLERNTAILIRNATIEPQQLSLLILAVLRLVAESVVVIALCVILVVAEPVGALASGGLMGAAVVLFHLLTRGRLRAWGLQRQEYEGGRLRQIQQGLGGAKEVKLMGREAYFEGRFSRQNRHLTHALQRQNFLSQLPRLWLEFVAIAGVALVVFVTVGGDQSLITALPTLGLFAAVALRTLPSINRMITHFQTVRFRSPALLVIARELAQIPAQRGDHAPATGIVTLHELLVDRLTVRYEGSEVDVLSDVSLCISAGTTVGIVGPSGAGKSTLVDAVLGLLPATRGSVKVNGIDICEDLRRWQRSVGYVPQSIYLMDDTIRRNIALGLPDSQIDDAAVWRSLSSANIDNFVRKLPMGLDTMVGERGVRLSGGQRQRLGIARALYNEPSVLVLDEATSALDGDTEEEVMRAVGALHGRKTVLVIAHRVATLADCDAVYRVAGGKVSRVDPLEPHVSPTS